MIPSPPSLLTAGEKAARQATEILDRQGFVIIATVVPVNGNTFDSAIFTEHGYLPEGISVRVLGKATEAEFRKQHEIMGWPFTPLHESIYQFHKLYKIVAE